MLREDGSLELYESEAEFRASLPGWAARDRFGIPYRHVEGDELAALQPGLSKQFVKATFVPGWKTADDPKVLGKAIWAYAERHGAEFVKGDVGLVMPSKERVVDPAQAGAHDHGATAVSSRPAHGRTCSRDSSATASRSRPSAATTRRCPSMLST